MEVSNNRQKIQLLFALDIKQNYKNQSKMSQQNLAAYDKNDVCFPAKSTKGILFEYLLCAKPNNQKKAGALAKTFAGPSEDDAYYILTQHISRLSVIFEDPRVASELTNLMKNLIIRDEDKLVVCEELVVREDNIVRQQPVSRYVETERCIGQDVAKFGDVKMITYVFGKILKLSDLGEFVIEFDDGLVEYAGIKRYLEVRDIWRQSETERSIIDEYLANIKVDYRTNK